ncbi:hypothetical protein CKM354_000483200 [Cercospora kikuchii]|uniref:Uncharacterized protein n=1 Tax=Cercospora kikuchii TaxID=84275 RepID=A0A9P3CEY7_9PEZI|nr:uncharacterized protein CKM354_000483200 [Cercospora kikuchii]GIZ41531.1 hypothetical protein CKM354_000483200 [Cercospora kikuchii]
MKFVKAVVLTTATMAATTTAEDNFVTVTRPRPGKPSGVTVAFSASGHSHTHLKPLATELVRPDATRIADALNTVPVESKRSEPESDPLPVFPDSDDFIKEICGLFPKQCPYWAPTPTTEDLHPRPTASLSIDNIIDTIPTNFDGPVAPMKTVPAAKAFAECNTEDRDCRPIHAVAGTPSSSLPTSLPTDWRKPICRHCRPLPTTFVRPTSTPTQIDLKPSATEDLHRSDPTDLTIHAIPLDPPTPGLHPPRSFLSRRIPQFPIPWSFCMIPGLCDFGDSEEESN